MSSNKRVLFSQLKLCFVFAIKIVETFKFLQKEKKEFVLSKQLLKSGTGMGAKLEEVTYGQSKEASSTRFLSLTKRPVKQNIG